MASAEGSVIVDHVRFVGNVSPETGVPLCVIWNVTVSVPRMFVTVPREARDSDRLDRVGEETVNVVVADADGLIPVTVVDVTPAGPVIVKVYVVDVESGGDVVIEIPTDLISPHVVGGLVIVAELFNDKVTESESNIFEELVGVLRVNPLRVTLETVNVPSDADVIVTGVVFVNVIPVIEEDIERVY